MTDQPEPSIGELTYARAAAELETILGELDDDQLDVDVLAERVQRASELIRFCRSRITAARVEVEKIVADLDQPEGPARLEGPDQPISEPTAGL